jgi:hypothetical protein
MYLNKGDKMKKRFIFEDTVVKYVDFVLEAKLKDVDYDDLLTWDYIIAKENRPNIKMKFGMNTRCWGTSSDVFGNYVCTDDCAILLSDILTSEEMQVIQDKAEKRFQEIKEYANSLK